MRQDQNYSSFPPRSSFSLSNFEGPLELLLYLIQKEELDVCDIFLKEVTEQFFHELEKEISVELGTDFLSITSTLLLLKSRRLLPKSEEAEVLEEEESLRFNLIQHLLEYCRYKEVAEGLSDREEKERIFFPRAAPPFIKPQSLGLEEVQLPDLVFLLQEIITKSASRPSKIIEDEEWQVAPMMQKLKELLNIRGRVLFVDLFSEEKSRGELIVLFLALLEMMKYQHVRIKKEDIDIWIEIGEFP